MKSPLWILNSILAIVLCTVCMYAFFSSWQKPSQPSLRIQPVASTKEEVKKPFDQGFLRTIYEENDLFGTYTPHVSEPSTGLEIATPPTPPTPKPFVSLTPPAVSFLEPLKITITGIITSTEETDNQVIIADAAKEEKLYKVGDKIADAHILRIFRNKVIFIRSNGQQETLFMNEAEAKKEIETLQITNWDMVVQQRAYNTYAIDTRAFGSQVKNLASFIEMLDVTTVFRNGQSVGCRIGKLEKNSLGSALGFQTGDIVIAINDIEPTTTVARVEIYAAIQSLKDNAAIAVDLLRKQKKMQLMYTIQPLRIEQVSATSNRLVRSNEKEGDYSFAQMIPQAKEKLKNDAQALNATVQIIKKRDKQAMKTIGSKKSVLQDIPR